MFSACLRSCEDVPPHPPCWLFACPPHAPSQPPAAGSYLVGFFFPATVTFFPLRVRALQRVFCPAHPNMQPPRQQPGVRRARAARTPAGIQLVRFP